MRKALVLAVLLPAAAQAAEMSDLERNLLVGAVAGVAVTYATINTGLMFHDLVEKGWSAPSRTVPTAFLGGVGLLASVGGIVVGAREGNGPLAMGAAAGAVASAALCFFVALAIHNHSIYAPKLFVNDSFTR